MSVYLLYSLDDAAFAKRLSEDLKAHGIEHARADMNTDERFSALHQANHVIAVLSPQSVQDPRVLATLSAVHDIKTDLIAVRIGVLPDIPKYLKGVFPLDFSNDDDYQESFATLLEDLIPHAAPQPLLPPDILKVIEFGSEATNEEKQAVIERLSTYATHADEDEREAAHQALRDMVFREKDHGLKQLLSASVQAFSQPRATIIESRPPKIEYSFMDITEEDEITLEEPQIADDFEGEDLTIEIWKSRQWWLAIAGGIFIMVMHGVAADSFALGFGLSVVWAALGWLNIQIRAGGNFQWDMPGPLVGNFLIGVGIALIATGIGAILSSITLLGFMVALLLGGLYGALIGWLSTLRVKMPA